MITTETSALSRELSTHVSIKSTLRSNPSAMAWFTSKPEKDTNSSFREDRSKCWEARDSYFACLDAAEVVVAGTEGSKCTAQRKVYEQNCAKSWVSLCINHPSSYVLKHSVDRLFQPAPRVGGEAEAYAGPSSKPGCRGKKIIVNWGRIYLQYVVSLLIVHFPPNSDGAAVPASSTLSLLYNTPPCNQLLLTSLFIIPLTYRPSPV